MMRQRNDRNGITYVLYKIQWSPKAPLSLRPLGYGKHLHFKSLSGRNWNEVDLMILLLQNFCVAISVSPHVCFILVLILISMFLR